MDKTISVVVGFYPSFIGQCYPNLAGGKLVKRLTLNLHFHCDLISSAASAEGMLWRSLWRDLILHNNKIIIHKFYGSSL